jgi:X-Pro dipeptidyl-peptidase
MNPIEASVMIASRSVPGHVRKPSAIFAGSVRTLLPLLCGLALLMAPDTASSQARPVFADGQAQIVPEFADSSEWIRHDLWVETEFDSDGDGRPDRVHVGVTRPRQTETEGLKVPVIYESSPYYSGTANSRASLWNVRHELGATPPPRTPSPSIPHRERRPVISNSQVMDWVPRGFAVVHSESPGTGLSQGCPTVGGANESLAPKAVIDWLNGRARGFATPVGDEQVFAEWSTGRVGMTGTSYNGTLPLAAATTGVEGLEAIVPVAPNTSYWNYYRSNGLVRHPGGWLGEDIDFLFDFINSGNPARREYCIRTVRDDMTAHMNRETGDLSDWWLARDYLPQTGNVRAATLMAHAFNDWNVMPEHSVRIVEALRERDVPVQVYFHQGGHGGPPPLELMNRWFTRYVYGIENGVERDPRAWIVRETADRLEPTPYPDYPHPDAAHVTLYPTAGAPGIGGLVLSRPRQQGAETLMDNVSFSGAMLAQAEWTNHRLLYATPVLADSIHISGTARITIRVAASKAAANLSVWLVELPFEDVPNRPTSVITRGWADPQNHRSLTHGEPLVPGEPVTLAFDLQPDDQVIAAGRRIALMVFSSDRDFTLWPTPGTELTVDLDALSIDIPVVGGADALVRAFRTHHEPDNSSYTVEGPLLHAAGAVPFRPSVSLQEGNGRTRVREGAIIGLVVGAGAAILVLSSGGGSGSLCDKDKDDDAMGMTACAGIVAGAGLTGAGLGALIGSRIRRR